MYIQQLTQLSLLSKTY